MISLVLSVIGLGLAGVALSDDAAAEPDNRASLLSIEVVGRDANGRDLSAFGTGVIVHPGGYALTATHVIDDLIKHGALEASIEIKAHLSDFTGQAIAARLVDKNSHDITILQLDFKIGGYPASALVCNTGFDLTKLDLMSEGFPYVCTVFDPVSKACLKGAPKYVTLTGKSGQAGNGGQPDTIDVSMRFSYGASGSPVYLPNGLVVGIAKGNLESVELGQFVPASWADSILRNVPGLPACVDLSACLNKANGVVETEKFVQSGGARAPGTGINTESIYDRREVCYSAPPGYTIRGQVDVADNGNNGGRGQIGPVKYKADNNKQVVEACVEATAWSEAKPFGAGGWQNLTLSGIIQKESAEVGVSDAARKYCVGIGTSVSK